MNPWLIVALTAAVTLGLTVILGRPLLSVLGMRVIRRRKPGARPASPGRQPGRDRTFEDEQAYPAPSGNLSNIADLEVSDVMVHRLNMRSINASDPPQTVIREVLDSPFTQMPVWDGSFDNIIGVLHAKDILRALDAVDNDFSHIDIRAVAARPWFVPDTTRLTDQLKAFLRQKSHFAMVVDEYGEVEGLVTLADIMEEVLGDISAERDINLQGVKQETDGSVVVEGAVAIRDLNRALGWSLPDEEATTIAGLVIHETQSIPVERQAFSFHGKRFVVMKREKNRIARLRIRDSAEPAKS